MAFRAHYALISQRMMNTEGQPTETIFGFFRMLAKLLFDLKPDYLLVVFDPPKETFRHAMYPAYKANRKETPEELKLQLDEVIQLCHSLGFPVYIPENEEADDYIASFAEQARQMPLEIEIASSDKDLFNILRPGVTLLRAKKGVTEFIKIDENFVQKELGVSCQSIPDYMALTGDASDNIPGVKGVGEKTAAKLIAEFGSLEGIYNNLQKVKPDSLRSKLQIDKDNAFLSRELVSLRKNIQLPFQLENLEWRHKSRDISILLKKGFRVLYQEFSKLFSQDSPTAVANSNTTVHETKKKPVTDINANRRTITELAELQTFAEKLNRLDIFAFDTETTSVKPLAADLLGLSFAWREQETYHSVYIPALFDQENVPHTDYMNLPDGEQVIATLRPALENARSRKIAQNAKYDILVLKRHGIEVQNVSDDTMIMAYVLDPNRRRFNMDDLAADLLGYKTISYDELTGTGRKRQALVSLPLDRLAEYAAEDAEVTLRLYEILREQLVTAGLEKLYREIDMPLVHILVEMETHGVSIDTKKLAEFCRELEKRLKNIENSIYEKAGEKFNINSTKELQRILFEKLAVRTVKKTTTGAQSTEAAVLEELRKEHPIVADILDYRAITKLLNTYVTPLPESILPTTGRIHTTFSQITAATGRLASHDPNLQNIPIKGEDGRALRRIFVAAPGFRLLTLDYSQIELRILAHYSEDPNLIQAYANDEDIHDRAAYLLFRNRFDLDTKSWKAASDIGDINFEIDQSILTAMKETREFSDLRSQAKVLNFSIVYGVTDFGLSRNLGITRKEAAELIQLYFAAFPGIRHYMEQAKEKARRQGYAENLFGRRRALPDINAKNRFTREGAERLAINTPIQSTAADIIKVAMIRIQRQLEKLKLKSRMILQIHDELLFEVTAPEETQVYNMAKDIMENVIPLKVPLKVSGGFGANWDEAK